MNDMQPGQLIVPHTASENPQPTPPSQPQPQPAGEPAPVRPPEEAPEPAPSPMPAPEPEQIGTYMTSADTNALPPADPAMTDVAWSAAEFVEHYKGARWYGALVLITAVIAALAYFFTRDLISVITIVVVMVGFGLFAARKPRTQTYLLSTGSIQIGSKVYSMHDFKAFSVIEEGAIVSVVLAPLKRFMPPLTLYVAPEVEERVFDFLSVLMPFEQHRADAVDSLMRRIRF